MYIWPRNGDKLAFSIFMDFFILEHVCYVFFPYRLKKMPQSMPEYALTRNYLELMVELPWNKSTTGEPTKWHLLFSLVVTWKTHAHSVEILTIDYLTVTWVPVVNYLETELISPRSRDHTGQEGAAWKSLWSDFRKRRIFRIGELCVSQHHSGSDSLLVGCGPAARACGVQGS